jgi:hypothetical protein
MGEILRIPTPDHPIVYYSCMMIELCKLQSTLHPALGTHTHTQVFEKVPYMTKQINIGNF